MKLKKLLCSAIILVLCFTTGLSAHCADSASCLSVVVGNATLHFDSFSDGWKKAVNYGKTQSVTVILNRDWVADGSGSFGTGDGFTDGAICYSNSKNITLDLNGHKIDRNLYSPQDKGAVIYVNSTLTVTDSASNDYSSSDLVRGGIITGGSNNERGGGVVIADNATFNFNGGTIMNCVSTDDGGAIAMSGTGAVLNVNGGSFYGNRTYDGKLACSGGAIYCDEGTVNILNSVFEGNYAEDKGGAIYTDDAKLTVKDTKFYSNSSKEEGGAVYLYDDSKADFTDCVFSHNTSDDDGGAIFFDSSVGSYLYDCKMYYNCCKSEGGALHINADRVFVIGGEYRYNTANEYGGGIYVDSMYDINVSGKLIVSNNTCNGKASDLCLQDGNFSTGYLYAGGLYEGSDVWLCSTDKDSQLVIKDIDKYQYTNYIHFDKDFRQDKVVEHGVSTEGIRAFGSALGSGNITMIIIISAAALILAMSIVIYKKKVKKKEEKTTDEKENS